MKFKCRQELLLEELSVAARAISGKTTMPILEGVLVEAIDDIVRLTCTDSNFGIITQLEAEIEEEGSVVLPGKLFSEIVRTLDVGEVSVSTKTNNQTAIRCGQSRITLTGYDAAEYPPVAEIGGIVGITLPQKELREMIRQTTFSVATDEARPIFTGCLMEVEPGDTRIVALDGFRLALRHLACEHDGESFRALIPGRIFSEVGRILGDSGDVTIRRDETHISFDMGGTRVIVRMLEGEFIRYNQIIPQSSKSIVRLNRQRLAACIDRASLMARDNKNNLLRFKLEQDRMVLSANSEMGDVHEEIATELEGSELEISFNMRYMSDIMKVLDDEEITMHFNSAVSPCLIKPVEGDAYTYLVLPVRSI